MRVNESMNRTGGTHGYLLSKACDTRRPIGLSRVWMKGGQSLALSISTASRDCLN
jgi:hypothetical protein